MEDFSSIFFDFCKMKSKTTETDIWLESLGYYRKHIAHDQTSLFRSVSEQIYKTQNYHKQVLDKIMEYANDNRDEFNSLVDNWDDYLDKLSKYAIQSGERELQIISKCYNHDVIVFDGLNNERTDFINDCKYQLLLCMTNDHFDVVYELEMMKNTGFCQSILYGTLYKKVFKMEYVDTIVETMLYNKPQSREIRYSPTSSEDEFILDLKKEHGPINSPLPYKVVKALDPDVYRNIEYDTWIEMRKEARFGKNNWYQGDKNLVVGTQCLIEIPDKDNNLIEYHCYIQSITGKGQSPCVVYIERLAERKEVPYDELKPLPDAKPWSLPWRYADKNINQKRNDSKDQKNDKPTHKSTYQKSNINNRNKKKLSLYVGAPLNMNHNNNKCLNYKKPTNSYNKHPIPVENYSNYYTGNNHVVPCTLDQNNIDYNQYNQNCSSYYQVPQEMFMGQMVSTQYNMYAANNNLMYYSREITKETSFGMYHPEYYGAPVYYIPYSPPPTQYLPYTYVPNPPISPITPVSPSYYDPNQYFVYPPMIGYEPVQYVTPESYM